MNFRFHSFGNALTARAPSVSRAGSRCVQRGGSKAQQVLASRNVDLLAPGSFATSYPLAVTSDRRTWFSSKVASHPKRREIEAHEAVHRAQYSLADRRPAGSRPQLEREANQGAKALLAGQPYEPRLSARNVAFLAYDPERVGDTTGSPPPGWNPPTETSDKYGSKGYAYQTQNAVGRRSAGATAFQAMAILQERPSQIFPFTVAPVNGNASIRLGGIYDLQNVRFPGDAGNLVKVTDVTPFSFTFTTLAGHFDGPGATIRFTTYENASWVILRQDGDAPNAGSVNSAIAPYGAINLAWPKQAMNLAKALSEDIARQLAEKVAPGDAN